MTKLEDPNDEVDVQVSAELRPSDDPDKVSRALRNLMAVRYDRKEGVIEGISGGRGGLEKIHEYIRSKGTVAVARRLLLKNLEGESTYAYLNKQAAYAGALVFCDGPEESPLGPIVLRLRSKRVGELIDWLAPIKEPRS